jgi:hypothetical protein
MDRWGLDLTEEDFEYMEKIEDHMNMSNDEVTEAMRILGATTDQDF